MPKPLRARIQAGETIIAMGSHQCNWEWYASRLSWHTIYPSTVVYKPLTNEFFGKLMFHIRSHLGGNVVSMHMLTPPSGSHRHTPRLIALGSDQVPDMPEQAYWTDFLHRDSPFYPGSERLIPKTRNYPFSICDHSAHPAGLLRSGNSNSLPNRPMMIYPSAASWNATGI